MIVGLSGKYGSGKNTAATILRHQLFEWGEKNCRPIAIKQIALADALKRLVAAATGQPITTFTTEEGKKTLHDGTFHDFDFFLVTQCKSAEINGRFQECLQLTKAACLQKMTYGQLLQHIGTDIWRDKYSPHIWREIVKGQSSGVDFLLVTDIKFPDEAEIINYTIRLNRTNRQLSGRDPHHKSETALDDYPFDEIIDNDGSIDNLSFRLQNISKKITSMILLKV